MASHNGMGNEMYEHIRDNIHMLELDMENGKILNRNANALNSNGYLEVKLNGKMVKQHQVFAVARWGEDCVGMTVNHRNEEKTDNSWDNLELLTHRENIIVRSFRFDNSTGSKAKQPIKAIDINTGEELVFESQSETANKLGINRAGIYFVLNGIQKRAGRYKFEKVS